MKTLYNLYAPQMLSVCFRYVNNRDDANDILQEAFYLVFKNLKQLKNPEALSGWIKRIVINSALAFIKNKKKLYAVNEISFAEEICVQDYIIEKLSAEEIIVLIKELPIGYRTVFNLYAIEGYSHAEIAEKLGISVGTSKSQLFDARKVLKLKLTNIANKSDVKVG